MKTAIVTGAGAGIGKAICQKLSQNNYRVGMLDLNEENVNEASKGIENSFPLHGDVTNQESIKKAFEKFGEIPDLLVNNAGIVLFGPLEEHSVEDYSKSLNINLLGSFITSRILINDMIKRGSGSIINMSSVNGVNPGIGIGAYPASKAGIISMTQQMAIEWGKFGIRVNCISPGFIDAGMSKPIYEDPKVRELRGGAVPSGRLGEADDIANAVLFLDSKNASYVNGHNLVVDGGVISSVIAQLPRE
ncbi:MAG: SDR family oxidoreductase [Pseudomonadota bacterium]|nr:SDR family oxidoreductase [Pseudomonadota bacterium]MEC7961164.1 SDR family oxidoreductase [Pseudomonadota bacterium]MEC8497866.1 SDR family oxidoreductase [Pseudomonadota bacterium]|tara:strand:+ start:870 stop:1610 length:741 start_codon:yes stop_codon:yes gene_type:complete